MTSPSADILTCDYRRTGSDTAVIAEPKEAVASTWPTSVTDVKTSTTMGVSFPASAAMDSTSGSLVVEEGGRARETRVGYARTAATRQEAEVVEKETAIGGSAESDGTCLVETSANTSSMQGVAEEDVGDRRERKTLNGRKGTSNNGEGGVDEEDLARSSIYKGDEERGDAGHCGTGGHVASTSTKATNKGVKSEMTMEMDYGDAVFPLALPGEAQEMHFGAAARAVVLASGSSRFTVSR